MGYIRSVNPRIALYTIPCVSRLFPLKTDICPSQLHNPFAIAQIPERDANILHRTGSIPFARSFGHTPRKLPAYRSNLSLQRTSSLYIIPYFYPYFNSLNRELLPSYNTLYVQYIQKSASFSSIKDSETDFIQYFLWLLCRIFKKPKI